jgi:hypothetical protein
MLSAWVASGARMPDAPFFSLDDEACIALSGDGKSDDAVS